MNLLELSNAEMGTFRVRLLRKGEEYGLHHQLVYRDHEPTIEFYGPAAEGERPADAHFMGRWDASQFRHPRDEWSSVGWAGYCGISPENSRAIAAWLERELNRPWTPPPPRPRPPSQRRANRPIDLQQAGNRRVTLYVGGLFGYVNKEAKWVRVDRRPHAQYVDAIFVDYLPRRARRARQMILIDDPDLVILLGWEHPDLQQATETEELPSPYGQRGRKMTVTKTKYAGADPRYEQEFESALDAYLARLPLTQLLLDLRGETVTERSGLTRGADPPVVPVFHPSGVWERDVEAARPRQAVASVFVSYHHGGDADARERFERENGAVIRSSSIYPGEISTGREVRREIRGRIVGCDFLVVLVGRDTYTRRWVDWEIRAALTRGGDGAPAPAVGILLPEVAALGTLLSPRLDARPGELVARLLQRSDELSRELMAATGTTVPARLLDNLLSGYAALMPWPASPAALLDALASSVNRARPVNRRCLLVKNLSLPSDDAPLPGPAPERVGTPHQAPNLRVSEDYGVTTALARNAAMGSPASSGVEKTDRPGHRGTLAAGGPTVGKPVMAAPAESVTAEDRSGWLVRALQTHGPDAVLAGLITEGDPEHARLMSALRRHAHVLAPLDSETSMAATLLARLDKDDALGDVKEELTTMLRGPYLIAVLPLPDLPPAGLTQVLDGGDPGIVAMAADPAERWLASLTWNGTLRVWDLATGTVRHVLARPEGTSGNSGRMLVVDPRGGWLAAGGPDGLVEAWDPIDGARLHTFTSKYGGINALAVDPEGAWLAAADSVGMIRLWSMPSGRPLLEKFTGAFGASALVADPEGRWLATGGGGKVQVWDVSTGERLHEFDSPGFVSALAVSPQGQWLCCAGHGATVRVWPMPGGDPARDLTNRARTENKRIHCLVADPAGRWLATAGHEGMVRTWSAASGAKELVLVGHRGGSDGVRALAVAPDGTWLASAGTDRTVRIWDMATGTQRHCLTGHTGDISALVTDKVGRWLASGGTDGTIRIWDPAAQLTPLRHAATPLGSVTALTADPAGSWHAYAQGDDGSITIRDTRTGKELRTAASHDSHPHGAVTALQADPHGTWLASAGRDGTIRIWDPRDGSEQHLLIGRAHQVAKEVATRLTAAPDGQWLACSGEGPRIWIWSPITGERLNTLSAPGGGIESVVIDPSGTWLASAGADGAIRLWYPDASRPHRVFKGHQSPVHALAADSSGAYLVSCGEDATIRVWNLEDGTKSVLDVPVPARCLAMCPRGGWFASTGGDAIIRVWDPREGLVERCVLAGHDVALAGITPDPTGRYLASVAADATVRIWEPSTGAAVASLRVDEALNSALWTPDHLVVGGGQGAYLLDLRGG